MTCTDKRFTLSPTRSGKTRFYASLTKDHFLHNYSQVKLGRNAVRSTGRKIPRAILTPLCEIWLLFRSTDTGDLHAQRVQPPSDERVTAADLRQRNALDRPDERV
jgi:hypothetical protein